MSASTKTDRKLEMAQVTDVMPAAGAEASLANGGNGVAGGNKSTVQAEVKVECKEAAKQRKKEDKSIEHILKALNSLSTPEEKLAALCKKYADMHEEHRILQNKFKQGQKKLTTEIRAKDQLQTEHSKSVLAKSKLESLCRELQRHNKLVKEESLARAREEEEKRKEVTNKFQNTIGEIQSQMNDHYAKNTKLREENLELANKLKGLIEQYETREQHIEKVLKHKELEQQLADAKLAQATLQLKEEQERGIREKQHLISEALEANRKISLLEEQEKQLRSQVALYAEKYEEFQQTLAKSNDVFQSFKTEMDKMTKKIKKLEKETTMWRSRWENSNKALLEMAEEKTRSDKDIATYTTKIKKLESLCRALQQDRKKKGDNTSGCSSREGTSSPDMVPAVTACTKPECSLAHSTASLPVNAQPSQSTTEAQPSQSTAEDVCGAQCQSGALQSEPCTPAVQPCASQGTAANEAVVNLASVARVEEASVSGDDNAGDETTSSTDSQCEVISETDNEDKREAGAQPVSANQCEPALNGIPGDVAAEPCDVAAEPCDVAAEPCDVAEEPCDENVAVSDVPCDSGAGDVSTTPCDATSEPCDVKSESSQSH